MARRKKFLTAKQFALLAKALDKFRFEVTREAREELNRNQRRTVASGRMVSGTRNASGSLVNSVTSRRKILDVTFIMNDYGQYVDQGRRAGKYAPVDVIRDWVRMKGLRPRDASGKFIEKSDTNMNSLAFLLNRAIKEHGIKKSEFFTRPFEEHFEELAEEVGDSLIKGLDLYFKTS